MWISDEVTSEAPNHEDMQEYFDEIFAQFIPDELARLNADITIYTSFLPAINN